MSRVIIEGKLKTGEGAAGGFTTLPWVVDQLERHLGITPFPGTMNLQLDTASGAAWKALQNNEGYRLKPPDPAFCDSLCYPVLVGGRVPAAVVVPAVDGYPDDKVEIIAAISLRDDLQLVDGEQVTVNIWQPPPLEAVVFDVDGTLVDTLQAFLDVARIAADPHGFAVSAQQIAAALNGHTTDFWEDIVPADWPARDKMKSQLHEDAMRAWPTALERTANLIEETETLLRQLAGQGLRLGIVTGNRRGSFEPLQAAGLMELFGSVITSEEVQQRKPHPEGLLRCLSELQVEPARAVYIGDTAIDITAAHAAGMWSAGVLSGAGDSAALSHARAHRLGRTAIAAVAGFTVGN